MRGFHATTAHGTDLLARARDALRRMIDHLEARLGLTREQAYVLCSVAADLEIGEVVDPSFVVACTPPLAVLRP